MTKWKREGTKGARHKAEYFPMEAVGGEEKSRGRNRHERRGRNTSEKKAE